MAAIFGFELISGECSVNFRCMTKTVLLIGRCENKQHNSVPAMIVKKTYQITKADETIIVLFIFHIIVMDSINMYFVLCVLTGR